MRLHGDMRVQVIERAICLLTTLPTTLVHSFDFFISTAGALVLLGTGNGNEGIDLVERLSDTCQSLLGFNIPVLDGLLQ